MINVLLNWRMFILIRKFKKIAKKAFGFLLGYGFNERQVDCGALEQNLVFEKGCWTVSICYYEGLSKGYKRCEVVDVIIEYALQDAVLTTPVFGVVEFNKLRANLKSCEKLFGREKVNQLNNVLANLDLERQISIQADFLKNNLNVLK